MSKRKNNSSRFTKFAIINKDTSFNVTEAFKAARTNLMFMLDSNSDKNSIVFTSYAPLDGKSTTCLNLAITFAQTGARILVIDADMRKPSIHRYMKIQSKPGLSEVLAGIADDKPCIYKTYVENLFVLPSGTVPPNPTELLISENMEKLIDNCSSLFDYVFIDTPPLGLVTDAAIVGSKTLGIINVVNCQRSRSEDIETIKTTIEQAGINFIGCIINAVPSATNSRKYYAKNNDYAYNYGYVDYYKRYSENQSNDESAVSESEDKQ